MRLRFLTATLTLFASITMLFGGFSTPAGAAPTTTASVMAITPDGVPDYCLTPNPPPICWVIQTNTSVFDKIDLSDFLTNGALVDKTDLVGKVDPNDFNSPCLRRNPPRWCWFVDVGQSTIIDPDPTIVDPLGPEIVVVTDALLDGRILDTLINEQIVTGGVRLG